MVHRLKENTSFCVAGLRASVTLTVTLTHVLIGTWSRIDPRFNGPFSTKVGLF
jgi:hypothetical protein